MIAAPSLCICISVRVKRKLLVTLDLFLSCVIFYTRGRVHEKDEGLDEVWVGVNDSDIITARRLVLFQCPQY